MYSAQTLNRCVRCGRDISNEEVGYFRLNERTDRFDLQCLNCYEFEQLGMSEFA
jgi:hypothetical protein